jgi:hypothetical protein
MIARAITATVTVALVALAPGAPAHAAPPHKISIADATIIEGDAGTTILTFNLTVGGPAAPGMTTDFTTTDVSATAGSDHTTTSGTVAFPDGGCKCATIDVPILGDTTLESDETFTVDLSNPGGGASYLDDQGLGTITNDDFPHATIDDPSAAESAATVTFTVTLDQSSPADAVIGYATTAGTATDGADYTGVSGTLTILAGSTSGTVDVTLLDDATYEGDEDFILDLTPVSGVVVDDVQGLGTIAEDDAMPTITVDDPTVGEGAGTMTFTVSLDAAAEVDVSVDYATSDNTATDGNDYTGMTGTATILAGATSTSVDVAVLDDAIYEGDETLNLDLTGEVNGVLSDVQGQGTITDDDSVPTIDVHSPTAGETDGTMAFTVSLDAAAGVDVSVDYATTDGTAVDASDYTGDTGTATVLAGDTSTTVSIDVLDDGVYEGDEDFTLDLSNEVNGTLGTPTGTGTITDDETPPGVAITDATTPEGNVGTNNLTFGVTLTGPSAFDISANYDSANGSASAGSDYVAASGSVTVAAGSTAGQVQVTVNGDTTFEGTEDLTVTLSNLAGTATLDTDTATGTITNDDKQPSSLSLKIKKGTTTIAAKGVLEPASGGDTVKVTLSVFKNGHWVKVRTKTVAVKKFRDRDGDSKTDAVYRASFPTPAAHRCRIVARFAGNANTLPRVKKIISTL